MAYDNEYQVEPVPTTREELFQVVRRNKADDNLKGEDAENNLLHQIYNLVLYGRFDSDKDGVNYNDYSYRDFKNGILGQCLTKKFESLIHLFGQFCYSTILHISPPAPTS
jgi:hypothetical protein